MRGPKHISDQCKGGSHGDCDGFVPRQEYNDGKLARRLQHAKQEDHARITRDWIEKNSHDHPCDCPHHNPNQEIAERISKGFGRAIEKMSNEPEE